MTDDLYKLLKNKQIIAILDGDTKFSVYSFRDNNKEIQISMPYLSGLILCKICTRFGLPMEYVWNGVNLSRWEYLDKLMEHCHKNGRFSDLLAYLFSKQQFTDMLSGHSAEAIEDAYETITEEIIQQINGLLYFGGNELMIVGTRFVLRKIGSKVEVEAPKIKVIDREYIKSITNRALNDVDQENYDSAITKSRTLLEETFCYVIEKKGEAPKTSGQISDLYKQVKTLYDMHVDVNTDRRIKMLLSGLEKIISAISEMRNKDSDAHGVGANRIAIEDFHARLFVNSAVTMADFILSVQEKALK